MKSRRHSFGCCRFLQAVFILLLLAGCATQREPVRIVEQTALPVYKGDPVQSPFVLRVHFHIIESGRVDDVRLLSRTGSPEWDLAVADSLKKWRFRTQYPDSTFWLAVNLNVVLVQAELINIGELIAPDRETASALHARLRAGERFESLAGEVRAGEWPSARIHTTRDANLDAYPVYIRAILRDLEPGRFSRPLRIGSEYIIYVRLDDTLNPDGMPLSDYLTPVLRPDKP